MKLIVIFLGGGLGSMLRYITSLSAQSLTDKFPLGTLLSNLIACSILALVVVSMKSMVQQKELLYLFLVVGLCGGYSTFSTFSLETFKLFENGYFIAAVSNILMNIAFCIGIIWFVMR